MFGNIFSVDTGQNYDLKKNYAFLLIIISYIADGYGSDMEGLAISSPEVVNEMPIEETMSEFPDLDLLTRLILGNNGLPVLDEEDQRAVNEIGRALEAMFGDGI